MYDALVDAGKCWASGDAPANGQGWREALEPSVRAYLAHRYPELREAALRTLTVYWGLPAYRGIALDMSRTDADADVRAAALDGWAAYARATGDAAVVRELAARLRDAEQPAGVRAAAYRGLLSTSGYLDRVPRTQVSKLLDVFPDVDTRVDWDLVARLTPGDRVATPGNARAGGRRDMEP